MHDVWDSNSWMNQWDTCTCIIMQYSPAVWVSYVSFTNVFITPESLSLPSFSPGTELCPSPIWYNAAKELKPVALVILAFAPIFWALTYYMYVYCNRLPCRTYGEEASNADSTCHICMSDFEAGQRVRTLTCFHEYHSTCIDQWLQVCMVLLYYIHRF